MYAQRSIGRRTPSASPAAYSASSETLASMAPDASEHLCIAARGQHVERWTSPRKSFPEGRVGYLEWRNELKGVHARRVGEIMQTAGYGADEIARVGALIRKERLKSDADAQMLEDVACIVFLRHYLGDFMGKTEPEKLANAAPPVPNDVSSLPSAFRR